MSFLSEKLAKIKELKPMVEKPNRKADERMYKILVVATTQIWEKQKPEIEQFLTSTLQEFADKIRLETEKPFREQDKWEDGEHYDFRKRQDETTKQKLRVFIADLLTNNVKE